MRTTIRFVVGAMLLASLAVASTADAQTTGKLRLTGGITPWAIIGSQATANEIGASAFGTVVKSKDYQLNVFGAAVGLRDRLELSYAHQDFDTMATGTALGLPGLHLKQNIFGAKLKLIGDAVLDQDRFLPQVAFGVIYKSLDPGGLAGTLTALGAEDHGTDFYLSATKLYLAQSLLLNATVRMTKANQNGLLGFGGTSQKSYQPMAEGSIAYLLRKDLAIGAEYRMKPDNLNPSILGAGLKEDDWHDVFIAFAPLKRFSITVAYAGLGKIVPAVQTNRQSGFYLSGQIAF